MSRYIVDESWTRYLTFSMLIPSTVFTVIVIIIVLTKSPNFMRKYKYVLIVTTLSVYQFDLLMSLICPTTLPQAAGAQYTGIIGRIFPCYGNEFFALQSFSFMLVGLSLLVGFVHREYSLCPFERSCLGVTILVVQFLAVVSLAVGFFPAYFSITISYEESIGYLDSVNSSYSKKYAIFCIPIWSQHLLAKVILYIVVMLVASFSYPIKAIYRVRKLMSRTKYQMSTYKRRVHKMLLRSILAQVFLPVVLIGIPLCVLGTVAFLGPLVHNSSFPGPSGAVFLMQTAAMMFAVPSLFSTAQAFTVLYFVTPYREYILQLSRDLKCPRFSMKLRK